MIRPEQRREWLVPASEEVLEPALTAFAARRIMTIVGRQPGRLQAKGGSTLAAGRRARALDWLPIRATIEYRVQRDGLILVCAVVRARGRPHLGRRFFDELYERKLSSWLVDLDRTLQTVGTPA
jgi:hypothetical protein